MFIDEATIRVAAGKGGDGRMNFLRNRHQPKGGPDGGDGGRGGAIVMRADHNSATLSKYRAKQRWTAQGGDNGGTNRRHGRNGDDTILIVPPGTTIMNVDTKTKVADLVVDGDEIVLARGGRGGLGNTHFASSTHQAPRFAELGEPGEEFELNLELKMIADVGLVGLPNAGKSTLLSVITSARPKIADYAFTTLEPQLGVASYHEHEFVVADIPGLIEGASQGKGLGDAFLKHIERTRVLLILIDASDADPAKTYALLMNELISYSQKLGTRPQLVALSKSSLVTDSDLKLRRKELAKAAKLKQSEVYAISSQEHVGLDPLRAGLVQIIAQAPVEEAVAAEATMIAEVSIAEVMDWYLERTNEDTFTIKGIVAERWAARTNFDNEAAVERLQQILDRAGVYKKLAQHKVDSATTHLILGTREIEW